MNKYTKPLKKLTVIIAIVLVVITIGVIMGNKIYESNTKVIDELREYSVETNGNPLRVAIIGDMQLSPDGDKTHHSYISFEKTLKMLKNKGMDILIIDGDFTDQGTKEAWSAYKEIYDSVMDDSEDFIPIFIMGNHDYGLPSFLESFEVSTVAKMQRRFTEYTGEYPLSHKVVNGYHFIGWGSMNSSMNGESNTNKDWVKSEIEKAIADDPSKPIFVITHLPPQDTTYGADDWGDTEIHDALKDYPQVISISGHLHYPMLDERSIWQNQYTAFSTQSLCYTEMEVGKFNGSIPKDAYGNDISRDYLLCAYMEISEDKVTIERINAHTGETAKEPWIIEAPFGTKESLNKYSVNRAKENKAPTLSENLKVTVSEITDINGNKQKMLSFPAGTDDDFIHSYKLQFQDENHNFLEFNKVDYNNNISEEKINEVIYYSDFVLGLQNMSKTAELRIPSTVPESVSYVAITAIDSWGKESESVICEFSDNIIEN